MTLTQKVWGGAWEYLFLTSCPPVILTIRQFGKHCTAFTSLLTQVCPPRTQPSCCPGFVRDLTHPCAEFLRAAYSLLQSPFCCSFLHGKTLHESGSVSTTQQGQSQSHRQPPPASCSSSSILRFGEGPSSTRTAEPGIFGTSLLHFLLHSSFPDHNFLVISTSHITQIESSSSPLSYCLFDIPLHFSPRPAC